MTREIKGEDAPAATGEEPRQKTPSLGIAAKAVDCYQKRSRVEPRPFSICDAT